MSNDAQPLANQFAARQKMLRERLYFLLDTLHPVLRADVQQALSVKGKLLSEDELDVPSHPAGMWPLLTLLVAQHIQPDIDLERVGAVALAVECYVCALDLLDDVEDEDQTPVVRNLGAARTLNVSTALLTLALQELLSLHEQGVSPTIIVRLLQTLRASLLEAVTGQHRDLLAESRPVRDITREECIEIAAGKAGAIMSLACSLGAVRAGAKKREREQFVEMGTLLGIAHQLDNDAHDLYYLLQREILQEAALAASNTSAKTDLTRGKKTLPVALAALSFAGEQGSDDARLDSALKNLSELSDSEREMYQRVLHEGIVATWGISLLYRERAHERFLEIEARKPVAIELRLLLGFETS
jgi:geranylgeranyl pyrophosphate synthase